MTSAAHRSESALGTLACEGLSRRRAPRVLLGGLGMGFTLRAVLDALPAAGEVCVAELHACVVDWCRGPLAPLTAGAASDPRVRFELDDVARVVARSEPASLDAVALDLFVGPHHAGPDDPLYGAAAVAALAACLREHGRLAVWAEAPDPAFRKRLERAGLSVSTRREGTGGRRHGIHLAVREPGSRGGRPRGRGPRRRS